MTQFSHFAKTCSPIVSRNLGNMVKETGQGLGAPIAMAAAVIINDDGDTSAVATTSNGAPTPAALLHLAMALIRSVSHADSTTNENASALSDLADNLSELIYEVAHTQKGNFH